MPIDPLLTELEQSLAENLNVESLAEAGLLSRSQLYREFYSATGHSVKEYVRKRRLSRALALIRHTDTPLEQIALECGFGSTAALCKSVKAAAGLTPSQYKSSHAEYYFPASAGQSPHNVAVAAETIPPTQCLRYYDSRLQGLENRAIAWLLAENPEYNGRIFGRNGKQQGSRLCYELYIESDSADQPAISGSFAKIVCPNIEDEINGAWDYLYNSWVRTSMFAPADALYFEEYIYAGGEIKRLQLYLPVVKRPGFHKLQLCKLDDMHFLAARKSGADAEKAASKAVMDYLAAHKPKPGPDLSRFYVAASREAPQGLHILRGQAYACGVALETPIQLQPGYGVEVITHPAGEYVVLEGACCGDTGAYESVLSAWAQGAGLRPAGTPFAVYKANGGYDTQDVRVKLYQKIEKMA